MEWLVVVGFLVLLAYVKRDKLWNKAVREHPEHVPGENKRP